MNKGMFMKRLRELLVGLPQQEANEAIQYYEDYFADAGRENEAKVLQELGSPEKVAKNIRAELGMPAQEEHDPLYAPGSDGTPQSGQTSGSEEAGTPQSAQPAGSVGVYSGYSGAGAQGASGSVVEAGKYESSYGENTAGGTYGGANASAGGTYGAASYSVAGEAPKKKNKTMWIVVAACTFYIWVPLLIAAFVIIFAIVVSVLAVGLAFGVVGLALIAASFALIATAVVKIFASPAGGMLMLGSGMMLAGIGIFFWIFVGFLFGKWLPALCKGIASMIGAISEKIRGKEGEAA